MREFEVIETDVMTSCAATHRRATRWLSLLLVMLFAWTAAPGVEVSAQEAATAEAEAVTTEETEQAVAEKTESDATSEPADEKSADKDKPAEKSADEQKSEEAKSADKKQKESADEKPDKDDEAAPPTEDKEMPAAEESVEPERTTEVDPPAKEPAKQEKPKEPKKEPKKEKHIIGATATLLEKQSGLKFRARVDSGAKSCSLHVEKISIENESTKEDVAERMTENIGKVISFVVKNGDNKTHILKRKIAGYVIIKTSNKKDGKRRYKVPLTFLWKNMEKEVLVTLNDRQHMDYPLLIGRNFLRDDFLIDVSLNSDD